MDLFKIICWALIKQKSFRDRCRLLLNKHNNKMREQESSSGSNSYESDLDQLLQNIKEKAKEASES